MQRAAATVDLVVQKVQFTGAAPSLLTIHTDLNNGLRIRTLAGSKFDPVVVTALESAVSHGKLRLSAVEVHV